MRCDDLKKLGQVVSLLGAACVLTCTPEKPPKCSPCPPAITACPAPALDGGATTKPTAAPPVASKEPPVRASVDRFFPGPDSARSARTRRANAVILFAPPAQKIEDEALSAVEKLRFQPIVCVLGGKLAFGARCGEAMPARTKVRLTSAGLSLGLEEVDIERSTVPFRDPQTQHIYPPPYGPACCMYNTCVGKTVLYYPKPLDPESALVTTKTVLAIWPADAELDLTVLQPGLSEDISLDKAPWTRLPCEKPAACLVQAATSHGRNYASVTGGSQGVGLYAHLGTDWQPLLQDMGVREYYLLSATDLDGDGRPELIVYARWANDYALHVFAHDEAKPSYGFSCGNI